RSDGNGGGERLQDRDLRLYLAAVDQDRFDGFGNAMPADALAAVAGHKADNQGADHRYENFENTQVIIGRRNQRRPDPLQEEEVGEEPDEAEQCQRYKRRHKPYRDGQTGNPDNLTIGGEIAERGGARFSLRMRL